MIGVVFINISILDDLQDSFVFHNLRCRNIKFEQVLQQIIDFIKEAPYYEYRLSIGTDSQVSKHTIFVTAIHLHRVGRGAIGFLTSYSIPRPMNSLREKIYYETGRTLEVVELFTNENINRIIDCVLDSPGKHGDIHFEFHLDVGKKGPTRELINEMVAIAGGTIFEPKIKPESYAASSYADRYTKETIY